MKRVLEAEFETNCKKAKTAIARFFKKYPELNYWAEAIEYMANNNIAFECDDTLGNGERNIDWTWALHFQENEAYGNGERNNMYYICIIEREKKAV